jgi:hypothetical protein
MTHRLIWFLSDGLKPTDTIRIELYDWDLVGGYEFEGQVEKDLWSLLATGNGEKVLLPHRTCSILSRCARGAESLHEPFVLSPHGSKPWTS